MHAADLIPGRLYQTDVGVGVFLYVGYDGLAVFSRAASGEYFALQTTSVVREVREPEPLPHNNSNKRQES